MADTRGEKVLLVGVSNRATPRVLAEEHLDELERLVETAGGRTVGRYVKERASPDPATYVGKGAVEEIGEDARNGGVALVIFDDELTPAQARNLEERWGGEVRVLDRPGLILDVFASHARTKEARTQVELAQLQYLLPRLAGQYRHLSRLGGGIGGRGAGEQKLELDRRKIRNRIARLRKDLAEIDTARTVRRRGRRDQFQVAIAGYTNAGKSTLFNRLTREDAFAADRLFATLDPRVARARSGKLSDTVFIDTVGFVRKLPTSLVASFRSTLSEIREADLVLHVLDASSPRVEEERRVAVEVLEELGVDPAKIVTVSNKRDLAAGPAGPFAIPISAKTGAGIDALEAEIRRRARPEAGVFLLRIPYTRGAAIASARARFRVLEEKDEGNGLLLSVAGDRQSLRSFAEYAARAAPVRGARRKTSPRTRTESLSGRR
ncbi:MAG: GTPase HflX [Acidobacteria bacterium]|nr:GTPase HflX [Acidobacteriota bacterium]MCA1610197.1 GTPase HflX [Acidobacteriota bacterium]